ncbi:DUF599 domain-containing protein [Motiliproteus sediminis]|uniref:DUF599 domain-containing protein n=1 Tax=Motiliproteus sediminis TaxID=1468178 RepID=UPI001AEF4FD3|nr:DUF599 family protein [Motiliproteus sediminis]
MSNLLQSLDWLNIIAVVWFLLCFNGYAYFAIHRSRHTPCLANVLHLYRVDWMRRMLAREARIADTSAIANLERSVAFFASSTMIVLAGLLTVMGSSQEAIDIVAEIPLVATHTKQEWDLKLGVVVVLFIYAFFKFTWSLRQYGFCSVLVGAAPMPAENPGEAELNAFVAKASKMISMAANNFNIGLRSYYFSLAMLGWFVNAWVFMALSAWVVVVLYRREFKSSALQTLTLSMASREDYTVGFLNE